MKKIFLLIGFILLSLSCTKVVTYAVEQRTETVSKTYASDSFFIFGQAQEALKGLGYKLVDADAINNRMTTGWKSVDSDSHYMVLFGRKDYAASSGAYYQLVVDVAPKGNGSRVSVATVIKTVAGKLKSSQRLEDAFFTRLDQSLRSSRIEVTNVGMKEK